MGAKKKDEVFLGKHGQVYGPFSDERFQELVTSGMIHQYSYQWESGSWKPIDVPPPPPSVKNAVADLVGISALCHDSVSKIVHGHLKSAFERGCELVTHSKGESPPLCENAPVTLSLLEGGGERSLSVQARITKVQRDNEGWIYSLTWDHQPALRK